jgi:L-iditol 2-dehydrogenase
MKALVYLGIDRMEMRDVPEPADEFVVRITSAGICGTDLKTFRKGHHMFAPPTILGHEFTGIVHRAPSGSGFLPGDAVAVAPYGECGLCRKCKAGTGELCGSKSFVAGGAFCEFVGIPEEYVTRGVFRIPAADDVYTLVEPLACVLNGVSRLGLQPGGRVLVVGSGPMGALFAILFKKRGIAVTVVEPHDARRTRVASWGIETRRPGEVAAGEFDAVVLAVARSDLVPEYVGLVADGGTVLLFAGLPKGQQIPIDSYAVHYREVRIAGSFGYAMAHFHEALALVEGDPLFFGRLITLRMPLEAGVAAFGLLESGDAFKIVLRPESGSGTKT